jgi:outer membrane receptor protein involved in Fe transport
VKNGVLVSTNETLAQVQTRILGTATQGALFTSAPGFVTFGLRGGWNINAHLGLTVIGENLTDKNYRLYGSGVDAAGRNVQLRARVQF